MTDLDTNIDPTEATSLVEPDNPLPAVAMADLPDHWRTAIARAGWTSLMPVQSRAMPYLMAGRDLMVQARTGSGKTGAFVLPILERLNPLQPTTQALVLVPTRELAQQVTRDGQLLAGEEGPRVTAVYGGVSYGPQLQAFRDGAHLVVGTPGRILDHLLKRNLKLDDLKILVFDEADRMMSMGFYPDMRAIQSYLPPRQVDTFMFSATFPPFVMRLARQFMHEPGFLSLSRDHVHVTDVAHLVYKVPPMDKDRSLVRLIEVENPESALIFCNTRDRVHYVAVVLQRFGFNADEISSDLSQKAREKVLRRLRQGKLRFLVATDVAARGIDIPELSHVFQYEPPEDPELYIHRAGRTGRAGASGTAVTLIGDFNDHMRLQKVSQMYDIEFEEQALPADEDVAQLVGERTRVLLASRRRSYDQVQNERLARFMPLARQLSENDSDLELVAMLLEEYYQQSLHAPPPGLEEEAPEPASQRRESARPQKRRRRRPRRN